MAQLSAATKERDFKYEVSRRRLVDCCLSFLTLIQNDGMKHLVSRREPDQDRVERLIIMNLSSVAG